MLLVRLLLESAPSKQMLDYKLRHLNSTIPFVYVSAHHCLSLPAVTLDGTLLIASGYEINNICVGCVRRPRD